MSRSEGFRAACNEVRDLGPGELVLLDEACRLIDRLDRFDALLAGKSDVWFEIEWPFEDRPARIVVSTLVSEARQHVAELRQVVKALDLGSVEGVPAKAKSSRLEVLLGGRAG